MKILNNKYSNTSSPSNIYLLMKGDTAMRHIDWHMVFFVGTSVVQEYWIYWGLPRIYFWDVQREYSKQLHKGNGDDNKKAA